LVENAKAGEHGTLHFIGLASDANVHSNIEHLYAMMRRAKADGIRRVRIHVLLDGRDTPPHSALEYIAPLMEECASISADRTFDAKIASGGGRQYITMDRYESDWEIVRRGWNAHVLGEGRQFTDPITAIETLRKENNNPGDQDLHEFVIVENGFPIGLINDGDSVILFNFRGDRAIQISRAFTEKGFKAFNRVRFPRIEYAGMMQYDGDQKIPPQYLVSPPKIDDVMGQYMADLGLHNMAISETQKYGHVTYFFNGNRLEKFDEKLEDYVEIKSYPPPFDEKPEMKCKEITDKVVDAMKSGKYGFIRINYPNGDMVGHTGNFDAVVKSMEALDQCLGRLVHAADHTGAVLVVTADHGNAEDKFERNKDGSVKLQGDGRPMPKTAHSLNPVPLAIYNSSYKGKLAGGLGLSSIAATCFLLMGYQPPKIYDRPVFENID
ncbi:MAG: 2,3-bisphosphoglycerate-independent phosphoglycerate mutase, partial [Alphaproteobacteria bacterium]|nr:2,3-bisphosphoglycerate-independent phosphoglycerate mutase [Alphaproteobacteria bacterium]